jgi:hypothetical protein
MGQLLHRAGDDGIGGSDRGGAMKAPVDAWIRIKLVLAEMDVDADNVMVGKRRLQEVLEREAMRYTETRNWRDPTARQKNEMIEEALAEIAAVRHRFEHKEYVGAYASAGLVKDAVKALAALDDDLRSEMVTDPKHDTRGHTRPWRDHYWFKLSEVFVRSIAPPSWRAKQLRRPLIRFLKAATGDTSKAIDNFVDRKTFNPRAIAAWRYWYEG